MAPFVFHQAREIDGLCRDFSVDPFALSEVEGFA
jgi:hypothetical protein